METITGPIKPFVVSKLPKEKYDDVNELTRDIANVLAIDESQIVINLVSSADIKGEKGDPGLRGVSGQKGDQGQVGPQGPTGAPGAGLSFEGDWVTATTYVIGDLVTNGGIVYVCIVDHTSDAANEAGVGVDTATYWTVFFSWLGVTDGSSAAAGEIGEFLETVVLAGAPVSLSNAVAANLATLPLTAGDWDVSGTLTFVCGAATVTELTGGIGVTSATLPTSAKYSGMATTTTTFKESIAITDRQVSSSGSLNVFIVAKATFSAGTVDVYGEITARRVR